MKLIMLGTGNAATVACYNTCFANFLAFRSKAHYNITYYYNLYTEQDQEDL